MSSGALASRSWSNLLENLRMMLAMMETKVVKAKFKKRRKREVRDISFCRVSYISIEGTRSRMCAWQIWALVKRLS